MLIDVPELYVNEANRQLSDALPWSLPWSGEGWRIRHTSHVSCATRASQLYALLPEYVTVLGVYAKSLYRVCSIQIPTSSRNSVNYNQSFKALRRVLRAPTYGFDRDHSMF